LTTPGDNNLKYHSLRNLKSSFSNRKKSVNVINSNSKLTTKTRHDDDNTNITNLTQIKDTNNPYDIQKHYLDYSKSYRSSKPSSNKPSFINQSRPSSAFSCNNNSRPTSAFSCNIKSLLKDPNDLVAQLMQEESNQSTEVQVHGNQVQLNSLDLNNLSIKETVLKTDRSQKLSDSEF